MRPALRVALVAATLVFAVFAGWRIVGMLQAERLAKSNPEQALQWHAGEPDALWALAEARLARGDRVGAASAARVLLAREPLQGRAFRMLAGIAAEAGRSDEALKLYEIAVHRAPRDSRAIDGLVQQYLQRENYPAALHWIDFYLRTSPDRAAASGRVLGRLVPMALDGRFAGALVEILRSDPPWRAGMLRALGSNPTAASRVFGELDADRDLTSDEFANWIGGLIAAGEWDEAHARWSAHVAGGGRAGLYNGDFSRDPAGFGFDWRLPSDADAATDFEPMQNGTRRALRLRFFERPTRGVLLAHPLHLASGNYLLKMRMRGSELHSAAGLVWQFVCAGKQGAVAISDPVLGSFDWTASEMVVSIPAQNCPGQWLRLVNPVQNGAAARVSGVLWLDDARIDPVADAHASASAPVPAR